MPHLRNRHSDHIFTKLLGFSPIVGVFGHRQVGKTTFLERLCASYRTFDDSQTLAQATEDSKKFLKSHGNFPAGIDECQLCPPVFPALKEFVRLHKRPGQFVISGSVRFYSRSAIRESLTGRIAQLDLLPLLLTELADQERALLPLQLIAMGQFRSDLNGELSASVLSKRLKFIEMYQTHGGLPGVCFMRNDRLRSERLGDQLQTILDQDVRSVYPTSLAYSQLRDFTVALASLEGGPVRTTELRQVTGIAEATQKRLLHALESVFLVRQIPIEGSRRGVCVYFEDQAEHLFLLGLKPDPLMQFEGLVYRNLRGSFFYETGLDFRFFQYLDSRDVRIPLCVRTKVGCLGVLPILTDVPTRKDLRMAHRFLQVNSPAHVLIVTRGNPETCVLEPRILQIPAERLLFEET